MKAASKYNLALVFSISGGRGPHEETNNRAGKIVLNAHVWPFAKMKDSPCHDTLASASSSLGYQ